LAHAQEAAGLLVRVQRGFSARWDWRTEPAGPPTSRVRRFARCADEPGRATIPHDEDRPTRQARQPRRGSKLAGGT